MFTSAQVTSAPNERTGRDAAYIPSLDGWRAVAICGVILCHAFINFKQGFFNRIVESLGNQGVSLFFAISGYLITTLILNERKASGRVSLRGFYIRRVSRIFPAAYVYLGVICIMAGFGALQLTHGEIASALFMYNNYWDPRSWYTQHFWSLSMEEHFYLFWPITLALLGTARTKWLAAFLIVATILWRPWSMAHVHLRVFEFQRTDMRLDAFLFACLLAILIHGEDGNAAARFLARPGLQFAAIGALAAINIMALRYHLQLERLLIQSILLPLIIVPTTLLPRYWFTSVLEMTPLRWIGRISYSLYLWQELIFPGNVASLKGAAVQFPIRLVLLLLVAAASYYWIETPLIRFGRGLSRRVALRYG